MTENYLGKILVATPYIPQSYFMARSLVLVCGQGPEVLSGFVLNKPFLPRLTLKDVLKSNGMNLSPKVPNRPFQYGGVEAPETCYVLHDSSYEDETTKNVINDVFVSSSHELFQTVAEGKGPKKSRFLMGFMAWAAQDLPEQVFFLNWDVMPFKKDYVFAQKTDALWEKARRDPLLPATPTPRSNVVFAWSHMWPQRDC